MRDTNDGAQESSPNGDAAIGPSDRSDTSDDRPRAEQKGCAGTTESPDESSADQQDNDCERVLINSSRYRGHNTSGLVFHLPDPEAPDQPQCNTTADLIPKPRSVLGAHYRVCEHCAGTADTPTHDAELAATLRRIGEDEDRELVTDGGDPPEEPCVLCGDALETAGELDTGVCDDCAAINVATDGGTTTDTTHSRRTTPVTLHHARDGKHHVSLGIDYDRLAALAPPAAWPDGKATIEHVETQVFAAAPEDLLQALPQEDVRLRVGDDPLYIGRLTYDATTDRIQDLTIEDPQHWTVGPRGEGDV